MIGPVEVCHQFEAHHLRGPDGDVGVSGEVAEDLDGEEHRAKNQRKAGIATRISVHLVHEHRQPVGDDHLLEEAPQHQLQPVGHPRTVELVDLAKLVQQILRALDGTRDQLRIEHHVDRENPWMLLRLLPAPIDLDDIGQALEGMEREAQRQDDVDDPLRVLQPQRMCDRGEARVQKAQVLEHGQDQAGGDDAQNQVHLPPAPAALRYVDAREVVDDDGRQDDEDVDGDEHHVEEAARGQQPGPTELVGQQEVESRDHWEEDQERVRVEEHPRPRRPWSSQPCPVTATPRLSAGRSSASYPSR